MEKDFKDIVKSKTKDELVRIVINKDEYKNELVEAATVELKLRNNEKIINPTSPIIINTPIYKAKETPFGVYLAGILHFITGPIWLFVGFLQAGASTITDDTTIGVYSMWNIIVAILSIVFGIGIIKGRKWGYEWGLGTALINILWFGYLYMDTQSMFFGFLILLEIIVTIALLTNKEYFLPSPIIEDVEIKAPNNFINKELTKEEKQNKDYKQNVIRLNGLIQANKKSIFGSSNSNEMKKLIDELCTEKENAEYLLIAYRQMFISDLIEDLKKLTSNYSDIKENCKKFIEYGIVTKEYPHNRIT